MPRIKAIVVVNGQGYEGEFDEEQLMADLKEMQEHPVKFYMEAPPKDPFAEFKANITKFLETLKLDFSAIELRILAQLQLHDADDRAEFKRDYFAFLYGNPGGRTYKSRFFQDYVFDKNREYPTEMHVHPDLLVIDDVLKAEAPRRQLKDIFNEEERFRALHAPALAFKQKEPALPRYKPSWRDAARHAGKKGR